MKKMSDVEQRKAAKEFYEYWKDKGNEKSQSQKFWMSLLSEVFGVEDVKTFIMFEETTHIDRHTGFIDAWIDSTKVLIEQKSIGIDLQKPIKQSDGLLLKPIEQARRYNDTRPYSLRARWIIICNFSEFDIYDMEKPNDPPQRLYLKDLSKEYRRLVFLVDSTNENIKKEYDVSFKAGDIVGLIYNSFSKQYGDMENEENQKSLNKLCVRLVFCLYAEDAGLFGTKNAFHDYLKNYEASKMRQALKELFKVLDTPYNERDPFLEEELNQFPYVNGGLFSNENLIIPQITDEIKDLLLVEASDNFNWSEISPTIFGAVFESTLNPETRRNGGMHYTSIENIHKVIEPLFLNELRNKLDEALNKKQGKVREEALKKFQDELSKIIIFDPACGSGNFLTETYLSLRKLENEAIRAINQGQITMNIINPIKVSINQFYGIEINDFAVKVATTALWIAESQMLKETENIIDLNIDYLPLKTYTNIMEGNALRIDWNSVVSSDSVSYIVGNPPFLGTKLMSDDQRYDRELVFESSDYGKLDYVSCWYIKAAKYMKNT